MTITYFIFLKLYISFHFIYSFLHQSKQNKRKKRSQNQFYGQEETGLPGENLRERVWTGKPNAHESQEVYAQWCRANIKYYIRKPAPPGRQDGELRHGVVMVQFNDGVLASCCV